MLSGDYEHRNEWICQNVHKTNTSTLSTYCLCTIFPLQVVFTFCHHACSQEIKAPMTWVWLSNNHPQQQPHSIHFTRDLLYLPYNQACIHLGDATTASVHLPALSTPVHKAPASTPAPVTSPPPAWGSGWGLHCPRSSKWRDTAFAARNQECSTLTPIVFWET